jgi:hypothetical protein
MRQMRKLLNAQGTLSQLKQALAEQEKLTRLVRESLPSPLKDQLQSAVLSNRTLSLMVTSPVWASRLRYQAPQLLRQLRQQGLKIEQIRPRIVPAAMATRKTQRRQADAMSPDSAKALCQVADALEAGPLQEALRRLSRHHK